MELKTINHIYYYGFYIHLTDKQLMFQNLKIKSVQIMTSLSLVHIFFILLGPVVHYYE